MAWKVFSIWPFIEKFANIWSRGIFSYLSGSWCWLLSWSVDHNTYMWPPCATWDFSQYGSLRFHSMAVLDFLHGGLELQKQCLSKQGGSWKPFSDLALEIIVSLVPHVCVTTHPYSREMEHRSPALNWRNGRDFAIISFKMPQTCHYYQKFNMWSFPKPSSIFFSFVQ